MKWSPKKKEREKKQTTNASFLIFELFRGKIVSHEDKNE